MALPRWDVFCRVVDNYGDIGVCWRLARQLAAEYGIAVTLWVDDLASFAHICSGIDAAQAVQQLGQVTVRHWLPDVQVDDVGEVVIEAFACELPASAITAMRVRPVAPVWLNLEYLSAEDWVEGCHQLASPQPGGLKKYFFFPGFTAKTGGVLGEQAMRRARAAWSGQNADAWLAGLGAAPVAGSLRVSLFAYENAAAASLLDAWAAGPQPVHCYLPVGRLLPQVADWAGMPLQARAAMTRGVLTVQVLPMLEQDGYDRLLWSCDLNFVRGEDSFVRAQWAGKPFVWHIYRQEEDAHLLKLDAFLARYAGGSACDALMQTWNHEQDMQPRWQAASAALPAWQRHARDWAAGLESHGDLAGNLVRFVKTLLK
ncbi:conserved hypothetical protein, PP_1857 family [Andreprevotia lacus DSM 23236]|jgi:uncharacterized repeat protein (TIGR03837 family)|uniref:Protein-arginine rhamnosyltransferase n=1 Tax=Andreprevotia lacus DSM 23236 TaxID=1121001 RepID=A0A1W1XQF4_9NEIS|nr:elongation factor P maturation arginine rhamnosyltransferase EarP [Andreprevotia lacus]SMC26220.1 conserved hypothetical protein, PP_1857 family [Andreprevotia lacus DSM 23236]